MERTLLLNPDNKLATWEAIKAKRNELEVSAITVSGITYDADKDSILRMDQALSAFDVLPTLDVNNKLGWKTFDNQVVMLSKTELQEVRDEIAKRGSLLHFNATVIHTDGTHLMKDLNNPSLWGV